MPNSNRCIFVDTKHWNRLDNIQRKLYCTPSLNRYFSVLAMGVRITKTNFLPLPLIGINAAKQYGLTENKNNCRNRH